MSQRTRLFRLPDPYDLPVSNGRFLRAVRENCAFHYARCPEYRAILDHFGIPLEESMAFGDGENDLPIVPDVGMFASFDPVALDMACADACNAQPEVPGSRLAEMEKGHGDHFNDNHPDTNWRSCLEHAEKIGLGQMAYELIEVK